MRIQSAKSFPAVAGIGSLEGNSSDVVYFQVKIRSVNRPVRPEFLTQVVSGKSRPAILGGNSCRGGWNGFSVWTWGPSDILICDNKDDPFVSLDRSMNKFRIRSNDHDYPEGMFTGGWIGYFSYDLGRFIESIQSCTIDDLGMPVVYQCFYDKAICYDHAEDKWWMAVLEAEPDTGTAGGKFEELIQIIDESGTIPDPGIFRNSGGAVIDSFGCNMSRDEYFKGLEVIKRYIYDGDVYQINFSRRFDCEFSGCPVDLFHWQNRFNPSPYSAYISNDQYSIVSASPELFISVNNSGDISTRPIKGTRPRYSAGNDFKRINSFNYRDLVESPKEQAELNMIIDLERNDLAKICLPGSRKVVQPRTIEQYPTVYHAVATVKGRLKNPASESLVSDILKGVFPGGSITGAPKIRSMEIIEQIEPTRRGLYTGSIGFIGLDGTICWNIAIRTILVKDGKGFVQTGGGIVADSDPESEWQEMLIKAEALLSGIMSVNGGYSG